jgi:hypothetical protein
MPHVKAAKVPPLFGLARSMQDRSTVGTVLSIFNPLPAEINKLAWGQILFGGKWSPFGYGAHWVTILDVKDKEVASCRGGVQQTVVVGQAQPRHCTAEASDLLMLATQRQLVSANAACVCPGI